MSAPTEPVYRYPVLQGVNVLTKELLRQMQRANRYEVTLRMIVELPPSQAGVTDLKQIAREALAFEASA